MAEKPELIAFSQNKIGGVQNFYFHILTADPYQQFDKKWILTDDECDTDPKLPVLYPGLDQVIFPLHNGKDETFYHIAKRLSRCISDKAGIVITNGDMELATLHLHRRNKKTVFHISHDKLYIPIAERFSFLIDVFIAHNEEYYYELREKLPNRIEDIYFIPYGIPISGRKREANYNEPLRIVMAARLQKLKGVYDIPEIDLVLKKAGVPVLWTIIGAGPEKEPLEQLLLPRGNFIFASPPDNEGVMAIMEKQDVFILPSRLDGLPVALLESMSVGCVPIISAFNEGIKKVVTAKEGFVLPIGDIGAFVDAIINMHRDREKLHLASEAAIQKIRAEYDVTVRSKQYFDLFSRFQALKKPVRRKLRFYAGLLSHPLVPSWLAMMIRKIK